MRVCVELCIIIYMIDLLGRIVQSLIKVTQDYMQLQRFFISDFELFGNKKVCQFMLMNIFLF